MIISSCTSYKKTTIYTFTVKNKFYFFCVHQYLFPDAKDEVQPKDDTSEQLASDSIDTANTNSTCDNSTEGMTNTSSNKTGDNESAENNTTGLPVSFIVFINE